MTCCLLWAFRCPPVSHFSFSPSPSLSLTPSLSRFLSLSLSLSLSPIQTGYWRVAMHVSTSLDPLVGVFSGWPAGVTGEVWLVLSQLLSASRPQQRLGGGHLLPLGGHRQLSPVSLGTPQSQRPLGPLTPPNQPCPDGCDKRSDHHASSHTHSHNTKLLYPELMSFILKLNQSCQAGAIVWLSFQTQLTRARKGWWGLQCRAGFGRALAVQGFGMCRAGCSQPHTMCGSGACAGLPLSQRDQQRDLKTCVWVP